MRIVVENQTLFRSFREALSTSRRRVYQFVHAVCQHHDPATDVALRSLLANDDQWMLLARLSHFDRSHHLDVYRSLVNAGYSDPDLLRAALLHDIGKADDWGRVRLVHRVTRVIGKAYAPGFLRLVSNKNGSMLTHGLFLAEHHARLGAQLAQKTGATERCCWLIEHHENIGYQGDAELLALIHADHGTHQ